MLRIIVLAASLVLGSAAPAMANDMGFQIISEEKVWVNPGADPAYETMEAARADVGSVLLAYEYPEAAAQQIGNAVMTQEGTPCQIDNADRLLFMRSGSSEIWVNVDVDFRDPAEENMDLSAPGLCWEFRIQDDGGDYILTIAIPFVCFNISALAREVEVREVEVPEPREDCAAVWFDAEPGDEVRVAYHSTEDRLPRSACWGLVDSGRVSDLPGPCDYCSWNQVDRLYRGNVIRESVYTTETGGRQLLLMPVSMAEEWHFISVCLRRNRDQSCTVTVNPIGRQNRGRDRVSESRDDWYGAEEIQEMFEIEPEYVGGNLITLYALIPNGYWLFNRRCPNG